MRVQCFVWQIPITGWFSIQSCAVGDESAQEYTQLNASCVCLILGDNGDNGAGVIMEAVGDNWPNAFSLPSESQSGSHK